MPDPESELTITLRFGFPDDAVAIVRLAALDSREAPPAPVLVAEVSGELRAVLSLWDGSVIADPFHRTEALVELLRARAAQLTRAASRARGARRRRAPALGLHAR